MPLLQAIKDIPIYSKVIKELCIKHPRKKQKDPLTIHVIGEMSECMTGQLGQFLQPTPSILELADHTTIKPARVLDDIGVSIASWEYPVEFMVVESKDPSKGNPIILGRPWLAIANAFIGCRDG